jgi:hypothetical protein
MRKMRNIESDSVLIVSEHIILQNYWEYYIASEDTNDPNVKFAYVMGDENELGYIYMPEIVPYILTRTKNLNEVMPATNYKWID